MRRFTTALALACSMALALATGAMAQTNQSGLVNVNVEDNVVQVPIAIAANICDVTVAVLANDLDDGTATCDALATSGATVTPREKGRMHVVFGSGVELDGHIDVLVTPQRLRLILLPTPGMPGSEAVIIEDFLFERARPAGTVVRLLSSGVPAGQGWVTYYLVKRRHWEMALARLKVFLEKGLDQVKQD